MPKTATKTDTKVKQSTKPTTIEMDDPFKKAKRCLDSIGETWYIFDQAVADIYTGNKFEPKYAKFAECAKVEWGMNYVTAMNHVKVGQTITKFNLTKESLQEFGISWTNFMEISGTLTPEMTKHQVESRIKKAAEMTHDEVVKFKKDIQQGTDGGTPTKLVTLTFKLKNEAADVVVNTLKQAKELAGTEYDDAALEYICLDWQLEHDPKNVNKIKAQLSSADMTLVDGVESDDDEASKPPKKKKYKERSDKGKKGKKGAKDDVEVEMEETEEEIDELDFEGADTKTSKAPTIDDDDDVDEEDDDDDLLAD